MNRDALIAPDAEDIHAHVRALPVAVLEVLAAGPLPDLEPGDPAYATAEAEDECRVCAALCPFVENTPRGPSRAQLHARELLSYHDLTGVAFDWVEESDEIDGPLSRWVLEALGALSHARCCHIYAEAALSLR